MDLSIIIPSFNAGETIRDLTLQINEALADKFSFEIIFVFDNGGNKTWQIIEKLKWEFPSLVKAYHLARNYGQHRAIQFGFSKAQGDFVITIDEDLQHDPADILKLIRKQKEGNYDIVYGKFSNSQHKGIRNRVSYVLRKILKHFISTLYDNYSPYRLIKHDISMRVSTLVSPYTFIDDFLSRITQNIAFEDILHHKRKQGRSSYTFLRLIKYGLYILLAYSKLVPFLLATSAVFVVIGSVLFVLSVISPENLNAELINNRTIFASYGIGVFFIILSFIGSFINHRNSIINTGPIRLLNENSI